MTESLVRALQFVVTLRLHGYDDPTSFTSFCGTMIFHILLQESWCHSLFAEETGFTPFCGAVKGNHPFLGVVVVVFTSLSDGGQSAEWCYSPDSRVLPRNSR